MSLLSKLVATSLICFWINFLRADSFSWIQSPSLKQRFDDSPFGHGDRPAPALLAIVYLWGDIRSTRSNTYSFLQASIRHLVVNAPSSNFSSSPILVLQTIQAQVLLSLYYMYAALPAQGRHYASAAASLALTAGLHRLHAPPLSPQPPFALSRAAPILPPPADLIDAAVRNAAFWAVVIVNNCWIATQGSPSAISYSIPIETPWPGGTRAGSTISKFLNGHDSDGFTSIALLAKASTLVERIVSAGARISGIDPTAFNTLGQRLNEFYMLLPPLAYPVEPDRALLLAHGLTLFAIIQLHAPPRGARVRVRAAADTISKILQDVASSGMAPDPNPVLPATTAAAVYVHDINASHVASQEHREARDSLSRLIRSMRQLCSDSPVMQLCLETISATT
ncbi:Histone H4 [Mycena indigotica]|uniref:Histone H4 n=1 Tax=Mycena indigotica TaxID=2126181 RepID=A0A8H6S076_9AGAR|nr:Histone H4 [Mycena indigotica]KAF7290539.1 Histone H4 [Mycena indigotica]